MESITAFVVTDNEHAILTKNYTDHTISHTALLKKAKHNSDVFVLDQFIVVYKQSIDLNFFVIAQASYNDLMLLNILTNLLDALQLVFRAPIEKRLLMENLDLVFLTIEETVQDGILIESDPHTIAARVSKMEQDPMQSLRAGNINEQTLVQALQSARDQLAKSLLNHFI